MAKRRGKIWKNKKKEYIKWRNQRDRLIKEDEAGRKIIAYEKNTKIKINQI